MTGHMHTDLSIAAAIAILLGLWLLIKLPGLVASILKQVFKDAIAVYVWRHMTGAHYHGKRPSDATWWSHGSTTDRRRDVGGFMDRWEHKPRAHRMMWRWACTFAFAGLIYGLFADHVVTLNALKALGVYVVVVIAFVIEVKIRLRVHNRHVVTPIVKSLAPVLRLSPHAVRRMVHISPENITDEGEIGYLELPPEITPGEDQQTSMARIIDSHLTVDSELEFKLQQAPKLAVIMAAQKPPPVVLWDDTIEAMEKAAYGEIVIGKDRYKNVFSANFIELDDPHWAFCVQSKRGKSNFLGLTAVQVLHQDPNARVIAVDPKRSSLIDFLGSPDYPGPGLKPLLAGVTMANDPTNAEAMWHAVSQAKRLFDQRSEEYSKDRTKKFPICLVIVDELNMLRAIIKDMWDAMVAENKRRDKNDRDDLPNECPIWVDIRTLLQAGRFVGIHVIAVAQDFRDDAIGGQGGRNYFGLRGLGGFHPNQWKMFVGTTPVPLAQKGVGRWIFTQGEDQEWVQITKCDPDKAYAWAARGRELYVDEMSVQHVDTTVSSASSLAVETDIQAIDRPRVVGIAAAAAHLGKKMEAFSQARTRWKRDHGEIPGMVKVGTQPSWYADDLDAWNRKLPGYKED